MELRIRYSLSKPFTKLQSAAFVTIFALFLGGIALWTIVSKKDCVPFTSPEYIQDKCQPYNLFDGSEVRQSFDGVTPFKYKETVADLGKDYKYRNNIFSCFTMNYYRIVLSFDRSTQINYNVSCVFDDGINFSLIASTISNEVRFGWDAMTEVHCPDATSPTTFQGFVFASNDDFVKGITYGSSNLDNDNCFMNVWLDSSNQPTTWFPTDGPSTHNLERRTVTEYSTYKKKKAAEFAINRNMRFVVGYTCSECFYKRGWDLALTLLTSLGSVGGIIYTVLIFIFEHSFSKDGDEKGEHDEKDEEKGERDKMLPKSDTKRGSI